MGSANENPILRCIADRYDPDELADILGLSSVDMVEAFEERILESLDLFEDVGELHGDN